MTGHAELLAQYNNKQLKTMPQAKTLELKMRLCLCDTGPVFFHLHC